MFLRTARTEEEFQKSLKTKLIIMILLVIISIIGLVLSLTLNNKQNYSSGFQLGLFSGIAIASTIFIIKFSLTLKNKEKIKREFIENFDERNITINEKAGLMTFIISILAISITAIFTSLYSREITNILFYISAGMILIHLICRKILERKY